MNNAPYDQKYKNPFDGQYDADESLESLDAALANADTEEPTYDPIPDGSYQVNIDHAEYTNSKTSGKPMVKWTLRILGPSYRGRLLWKHSVLSSRSMRFLKKDLTTCGIQPKSVAELKDNLEKILDIKLEIRKVTNGDFENIYFNKRIIMSPEEEAQQRGAVPPDARAQF